MEIAPHVRAIGKVKSKPSADLRKFVPHGGRRKFRGRAIGGLGNRSLDFSVKVDAGCKRSWWVDACRPEDRAIFIELAHQRDEQMQNDWRWRRLADLSQIGLT